MYSKNISVFQGQIKTALKEALPTLDLTFNRLFQRLRIKSHLTGAGIRKYEGYAAVHLVFVMFTSVFLNLPGLCGPAHLNLTALTAAGKDAFYRLKHRDLSWRSFLWRFLAFVAQQLGWSQQAPTETYFVLDTTVLPKRGEKIREVSNLRWLGLHGLGRLKAGKSRYLYQGREYTLEELYRLVKPNLSRCRALGYDLARVEVTCAN